MDTQERLDALRALRRLLDEAFRVPGTRIRFGWDAIVGLVPGIGDLVTALMACAIIVQAHQMRVPRIIQARMLINVGIDLLIGAIPFAGDVADVFWKANTRNFALLERHAGLAVPVRAGDWLFVLAIVAAIMLVAAIPLALVLWAVQALVS